MPDFETIVDDFAFVDEWEERYKYIIDLGNQLAPMEEAELTDANKVRGCASQVWLAFDEPEGDTLKFRGTSDAHIVRGLIALLTSLYDGKPKTEVLTIDPKAELAKLDLEDHITPQRSNGLVSMINRIRQQAEAG